MSLAESFLALVKRASLDVDLPRLREETAQFAARCPELSTRRKAERLVESVARKAAALGAAAGLPPGWAALASVAPELSALLLLQSRMIVAVHLLYGRDPEPEERAGEVLASLAAGAGLLAGRRLTARTAEALATRLLVRLLGREAVHFVPLLGAAAGAALNYATVRAVGRAVVARVEARYGPPEIPGRGPIVDGTGRLT